MSEQKLPEHIFVDREVLKNLRAVYNERLEQIHKHGFDHENDAHLAEGALAALACWFLLPPDMMFHGIDETGAAVHCEADTTETFLSPFRWGGLEFGKHPQGVVRDWLGKWIAKREEKTYKQKVIVAAALLLAELDNIDRRAEEEHSDEKGT